MKLTLKLMVLIFSLCAVNPVSANNVKEKKLDIWGTYVISEPIEPSGENKDIDL